MQRQIRYSGKYRSFQQASDSIISLTLVPCGNTISRFSAPACKHPAGRIVQLRDTRSRRIPAPVKPTRGLLSSLILNQQDFTL